MFQFSGLAFRLIGMFRITGTGCPIRIPAGQGLFAPLRRFSQLITSFFASESPGIHRAPFFRFFSFFLVLLLEIISVCQRSSLSAVALALADNHPSFRSLDKCPPS